ncbi:MAG: class I SAM-dependent methyltransferase [Planctomycetota bacterium]
MSEIGDLINAPFTGRTSVLETHYARIRRRQMDDFRAYSLLRLVSGYLPSRGSVLDVGCGTGGLLIFLARKGFDVRGIDRSPEMISNARASLTEAGLCADLVGLDDLKDIKGRFTAVTALDVIEHVEDDCGMLRAMADRVEEGGRLIVTVPAIPWFFSRKDIAMGHRRRYSPKALYSAVAQTGLKTVKLRYWNCCGVIPTLIATKIFRRAVNEQFRYDPSPKARFLNRVLRAWLTGVENRVDMPIGLTLLIVAERSKT